VTAFADVPLGRAAVGATTTSGNQNNINDWSNNDGAGLFVAACVNLGFAALLLWTLVLVPIGWGGWKLGVRRHSALGA
jgi:hypothetical protein